MTRRGLVPVCCFSALVLGCNAGQTPVNDDAPGPMVSYRNGAGFNADQRVFMRGDVPRMPTLIHAEYVEEFVNRPGFGGGRLVIVSNTQPDWTELVPESEEGRAFHLGDGRTNPVVVGETL